jgi:hypothetical protein
MPLTLYKGRFNPDILRQLRLNMLTSKNLMDQDNGSAYFEKTETFSAPFDPTNEQLAMDFLLNTLEEHLSKLKPRDHYLSRVGELEAKIDSLDTFHLLNVNRLHLDEVDILKGNLDYLTKAKDANIKSLYSRR